MSTHESWALVCQLFASGTPVFRATLSPQERAACDSLGAAIKPTVISQSSILCPYCRQHSGLLMNDPDTGRVCHCPECGVTNVTADDLAAIRLNETWLHKNLRLALEIQSRDGVTQLDDGVWRLGDMRRDPVILARSVIRVATHPSLLTRVRVEGGEIRVITPRERGVREAPFPDGVTWLPLEERFAYYAGGITMLNPAPTLALANDHGTSIHGPFSEDFKTVTLPDSPYGVIRITAAQARVMRAIWSFKGVPATASQIMAGAKLGSEKPIDVFKIKKQFKNSETHRARLYVYQALIETDQWGGLYWIGRKAHAP